MLIERRLLRRLPAAQVSSVELVHDLLAPTVLAHRDPPAQRPGAISGGAAPRQDVPKGSQQRLSDPTQLLQYRPSSTRT